MNVNLHIDSIVLDGIDLVPGQNQILHQIVTSELTNIFALHGVGSSLGDANENSMRGNEAINLGPASDLTHLGPQLARAIYGNIPQQESSAGQGGQP